MAKKTNVPVGGAKKPFTSFGSKKISVIGGRKPFTPITKTVKKTFAPANVKKASTPLGNLSFLFGAGIAVIAGIIAPGGGTATLTSILIILGIIVGLLNVTRRETGSFLIATVSLVIVSALGGAVLSQIAGIGIYLEGILISILTFVIPATIIVALKSIYSLAATK